MSSIDPFSQTYEGIWTLVNDFQDFTDMVRVGNRVRLDQDNRDPRKESLLTMDLPEVILYPTGGESNLHANSSQSRFTRRYTFMLSTGDLRVDYLHFPLQWYVIRAMTEWKKTIGGLTYEGHAFLTDMNLPDTTEGESDPEANRNIQGWSSLITIEAVLEFPTKILRIDYNA